MGNSLLHLVYCVLLLVVGGAAEDLLPRVLGVGFPVLLAAALHVARRGTAFESAAFAVAAGAFEDALGGLPTAASASYFLLAAWAARRVWFPDAAAAFAYPCYFVWLWAWTGTVGGEIFGRLLASFPVGLATSSAVEFVCSWAERGAALDEAG